MFTFEIDEEITLKLLNESDAEEMFQLIDNCREYLREWLGWIDGTKNVYDSKQFIKGCIRLYEERQGLTLGIFFHGKLAGVIGFNSFDWTNRIGVIGYWLGNQFQGEGIMTRAVIAVIDYGFQQLGLNRIEIRAAYENYKSRAIPERLGFMQEGQIRQGEWLYDHFVDLIQYGLLASEWDSERGF
ncbi:GNAT family N-acetyltransferase [Ornithinibacillus halotolerans]|uniref:Ribosomal-protein-serine acetyltransferase n=1 Tax=Ornithinibacillus halotolerans TaxID=1274357 RepID=A0A916W659_9BACI|nr:GNAT family protein [Ornithinibacillus halotolerans]GGA70055.1 ribosomal-protein-serine acetyltransferase [Ornithinibacillus halotolerans]